MAQGQLKRELGVGGATLLGLGSILGTGVFVSLGIGADITGPAVVIAVALAAFVALCNGMSSAQLAASHPVSGGTYEYGYKYLSPIAGFIAGWMFLAAKSASAATAALGLAGYLSHALNMDDAPMRAIALPVIAVLTAVTLAGIRRSSHVNTVIVSITIVALIAFVLAGASKAASNAETNFASLFGDADARSAPPWRALLEATALMFVAYTGYGRIATLGEEVRTPRRTIPMAIIVTLAVSLGLYASVAAIAVAAVGSDAFAKATSEHAAPLEIIAGTFEPSQVRYLLAAGAITAMLGVLLNLILGLSRVLLAMGRRADMPRATANVSERTGTPTVATVAVALIIAGLALLGDVKLTWSFSAAAVLIYYALTNAAALRLPPEHRLYPRVLSWCGLFACVSLVFFIEPRIWLSVFALIALGLVWHAVARAFARRTEEPRST